MNYNDNGEIKQITVKAGDTLPVGTEVDYDGNTVPDGWEEVEDDYTSLLLNSVETEITFYTDGTSAYKVGNLVVLTINGGRSGSITANTSTIIATLPEVLRPKTNIVSDCIFHDGLNNITAGQLIIYANGEITVRFSGSSSDVRPQFMFTITYISN